MIKVVGDFHFGRQFALVMVVGALSVLAGESLPLHGVPARFGLYGALYSCAVASSVRAPTTLPRRLLFIALGALASMATADLGLQAGRFGALSSGWPMRTAILAGCAGVGAVLYERLVPLLAIPRATSGTPAAVACMAAVLVPSCLHAATRSGGAWVAVAWWFAFSLSLWYQEAHVRHS